MAVLTPIWTEKPETASRVRQRIETVLDWAVAQGYRSDNPAARSITKVLPRMPRTKQHHQALRYPEVPQALETVRQSTADTVTKLAFEFLVLTAARSSEVRLATWDEINWVKRKWTVPAERMKARREHKVPYPDPKRRCGGVISPDARGSHGITGATFGRSNQLGTSRANDRLGK